MSHVSRVTYHVSRVTHQVSRATFLVFLAALLPRVYALGGFLTIDEVKWAEGVAQFLLALSSGNLAQTYWHFFPGITLAWGGALTLGAICLPAANLAQCVQTQVERLPDSIGWLRLTPVLLTSVGIAGVYGVGRKLVAGPVALLAALLLAFDPFFIAHSRILNGDAITAVLMFLSLLSFLNYSLAKSANSEFAIRHSLVLSAVLAGLALLTKLPAPIIALFIGGLGLVGLVFDWPKCRGAAVRRWIGALALWGVIALAVVFLLWPALWVAPAATLQQMYIDSFEVGQLGEGHDAFFVGQNLDDPGPWFYPYAIAFRLTPVVTVGLVLAAVWLVFLGGKKVRSPELKVALVNGVFIVFIVLLANLSPKKLDRYVMAVIPPLLFLAAQGLWWTWQHWLNGTRPRRLVVPLLAGLVILHLVFAILAAPYYLTYYNPLLGGVEQAARQVPVGWGEGLEQAAAYLSRLPEAESLTVSSWYSDIFNLYFAGQRNSFSDDGRGQLSADYVVFYINQWQRQKPYPELVNYFRSGEPVFTVKVGPPGGVPGQSGVNWVEVYKAPAAQSASGGPKIEGVAQLLAYKIAGRKEAGQVRLSSGQEAAVTLFLRVLGPLPENTTVHVSLANPVTGINYGTWHSLPRKGEWQMGNVVEWPGQLVLPADLPFGDYRFAARLQNDNGAAVAEFTISEKDPLVRVE